MHSSMFTYQFRTAETIFSMEWILIYLWKAERETLFTDFTTILQRSLSLATVATYATGINKIIRLDKNILLCSANVLHHSIHYSATLLIQEALVKNEEVDDSAFHPPNNYTESTRNSQRSGAKRLHVFF